MKLSLLTVILAIQIGFCQPGFHLPAPKNVPDPKLISMSIGRLVSGDVLDGGWIVELSGYFTLCGLNLSYISAKVNPELCSVNTSIRESEKCAIIGISPFVYVPISNNFLCGVIYDLWYVVWQEDIMVDTLPSDNALADARGFGGFADYYFSDMEEIIDIGMRVSYLKTEGEDSNQVRRNLGGWTVSLIMGL
jgi:hypothetical protein